MVQKDFVYTLMNYFLHDVHIHESNSIIMVIKISKNILQLTLFSAVAAT